MQTAATGGTVRSDGSGASPSSRALRSSRRVRALERREVHHPHRQIEREELRLPLDRPAGERGGALLDRNLVDGADSGQPGLEG
jgi:hypothetical protein